MITDTELRLDIAALYADYAACLDNGEFQAWPEFFTEECRYRVVARENHAEGLPLSVSDLRSRNALKDRVYGIEDTIFHAPYYQRHIIGPARIRGREGDVISTEANYLVIRTKRDLRSDLFNAGRYLDKIVRAGDRLLFAEKICVYDSEIIPNSLIYPV